MKKILLLSLLFCAQLIQAQTYELDIDAKVIKSSGVFKKGNTVLLKSMVHNQIIDEYSKQVTETYTLSTSVGDVTVKEKLEKVLDINYKDAQSFWDAQIIFNVLESLAKNGTQVGVRAEMEQDALEYINKVNDTGLSFNDPFLESYIYSIITKLAPGVLIDGRPGSVNLLISRRPYAQASMFPNGTLEITTSLIALLHSEDELAAILAHELAHFVLDHSVQNYIKMVKAQKRAEFWAAFATALTGVAEGVAAAKNPYYIPGYATLSVAVAANQIASAVCKRLGMEYSKAQEIEADEKASELMRVMGYDPNALATALSRIEETMKQERSTEMYFASDHPALIDRINKAGKPSLKVDQNFERIISFAVSDAAYWKMQDRRFKQALPLVSQNINNNVATVDDYIQKANCLLYLKNDTKSYTDVINLIENAKSIRPNNINIYKTEIVAYLRQGKYDKAKELLKAYKEKLLAIAKKNENYPASEWSRLYKYAFGELEWTDDMSQKLKAF